jgi:hypothetical protein
MYKYMSIVLYTPLYFDSLVSVWLFLLYFPILGG